MPAAMLAGAALAFYALVGFEDSVNVAEETQGPEPHLPEGPLRAASAIAGVLYFLVTVGASAVVPTADLTASSGPLLEVVKQGPLGIPEKVFSAIGLLALSNGALINMIMASRLLYGMAQEGVVPAPLGIVGSARRTPWVAILLHDRDRGGADHHRRPLEARRHHRRAAGRRLRDRQRDASSSCAATRSTTSTSSVPSIFRCSGSACSIALLTQIEAEVWARAGILIALGLVLWLLNALVLRVQPASA